MGFWTKLGKGIGKVGSIVAPFTGPFAPLVGGATGFVGGLAEGKGVKNALLQGGIGAATSFIPGGGGAAGGLAKVGAKSLISGLAKGAATNFATGTATGLATGQGVKQALKSGGSTALQNVGSTGVGGGLKGAAKSVAKQTALNVGSQYAGKGLQAAGVPGGLAAQGGNVFTNYLGNKLGGKSFSDAAASQAPGGPSPIGNYLPSNAATSAGPAGLPIAASGSVPTNLPGVRPAPLPIGPSGSVPAGVPGRSTPLGAAPPGGGQPVFRSTTIAPPGAQASAPGQPAGPQPPQPPQPPQQQQQQQQPPGDKPATWAERYGPILTQAGGAVLGGYVGKKAQESAMKRSPEEQAALTGAQGSAGQLGRAGGELVQQGQGQTGKAGQYFQTLLGGNRAAMSQAIAGPAAQIAGNYRGAERNLNQQGVRGAARDVAAADLNRQRVSQIAGLTTGMQPYAAEQLSSLGQNTTATGTGALANAGNLYQGLLGQGYQNRRYGREEGEKTASAIGGLARDVGEVAFKRQPGGSTTPAKDKKKPQGGTPVAAPPTTADLPIGGQLPNFGGVPLGTPPPVQTGAPNQAPAGYPFGPSGDYDPNRAAYRPNA